MNEMEIKQQEIINLQSQLSSSVSPIGDWKVIKCYEAKLMGNPMPYDYEDLIAKREAVRNQIRALEGRTHEETTEEKIAYANANYENARLELSRSYANAIIDGDTEIQKELLEEVEAVKAQYQEDIKDLITEEE